MQHNLKQMLDSNFIRMVIVPLFSIILLLGILFVVFRSYMFSEHKEHEIQKVETILSTLIQNKKHFIEKQFTDIEHYAIALQKEHEEIFKNAKKLVVDFDNIDFQVANNGVFYKTTPAGSSLYYSSDRSIGKEEKAKAIFTEAMDKTFKMFTEINDLIVAVYFNSYDGMNRIYPPIKDIYQQYGPILKMQDYNFYYLADIQHNPERKPVWTQNYLDPAGNGWMISCVVPIYNQNTLEGVSGIDINFQHIIKNFFNENLSYGAEILLMDKNGSIVAKSAKTKRLLDDSSSFKQNLFSMREHNQTLFEKEVDGKEYIFLKKSIKNNDALIFLYVEKEEILNTIFSLRKASLNLMIFMIVLFIFSVFIVYLLSVKEFKKVSKRISEPIVLLSKMSADIEKYKAQMPLFRTGIEEIDELGSHFKYMVHELNAKQMKLEKFNEELEQKVEEAIKEIREQNENLSILLNITMESIVIFNSNYNLIQANQATVDIFGYSNTHEMQGLNIYNFIPDNEKEKVQKALERQNVIPYEITLYKKDKTTFPALVRGHDTVINDENHRIVTIIDLSDIKEKDKQLLQQSKQAQMGEMISMIAHQWRQPLNAISASSINLTLMANMGLLEKDKVEKSSSFIQQQCQKMSGTIETFMNFVKPSKEKKFFTFKDTLASIMQIMEAQLKNHNIEVKIEIEDDMLGLVGYADQIEQVIINILANARDAFEDIERDDKQIRIKAFKQNGVVVIRIEDNAGGIKPEIAEKIFNPYFTTKEQGKGTGLGLYMSMDIMRKSFGGDLVYEKIEDGSCFYLVCN